MNRLVSSLSDDKTSITCQPKSPKETARFNRFKYDKQTLPKPKPSNGQNRANSSNPFSSGVSLLNCGNRFVRFVSNPAARRYCRGRQAIPKHNHNQTNANAKPSQAKPARRRANATWRNHTITTQSQSSEVKDLYSNHQQQHSSNKIYTK